MELHPDRNYGNVEDATRLFAEIQAAYEVLSDPQERAWYDSHRDAILRDDEEGVGEQYEHNIRVTTADDIMKMFTRFNSRVDFSDSSTGFYGVLRDTFNSLATEEDAACDWEGVPVVEYPSFGHAEDDYEEVVKPFYAAWNGFATRKNFAWKDAFRYSEAPDRRVRRMMEKDNKRLRDEGMREFNDAVRSLVSFVRKRDPRYRPNTQTEAERQRILRDAATAQAIRSRAANRARLEEHFVPEWANHREPDLAKEEESQESEIEEQRYECVACHKTFKSERQFEAHERSKKHLKEVRLLHKEMQEENDALDLDQEIHKYKNASGPAGSSPPSKLGNNPSIDTQSTDGANTNPLDDEISDMSYLDRTPETQSQHAENASSTNQDDYHPSSSASSNGDAIDDEYAPRNEVESRILGSSGAKGFSSRAEPPSKPKMVEPLLKDTVVSSSKDTGDRSQRQKLGKAKEKRARKAAQQKLDDPPGAEV